MERYNSKQDYVLRELRVAEAIVDEILTELDALREMTCNDSPLDSLLDKVLLAFSKTLYWENRKQRKENIKKLSMNMQRARRSKSI